MSCHVISRLLTSCHIMSCHVMSCHVMSCHVMSRLVMSCHLTSSQVLSRHVMSCHVTSCHVMSCHLTSSHVFSRLVISCHVMSCHVFSCHVMSSHVFSRLVTSCHIMSSCSRILLPNLSSDPSKFFYYGGGVAPTRFSKPWLCAAIRLGATLSLWRRVHCERLRVPPCAFLGPGHRFAWQAAGIGRVPSVRVWRRARFCDLGIVLRGRLRGSGVLRACRGRAGGRAAALCRGDWVPGVFCTRMANVRFAWQAAGIVRAGSVLGACWRAVSAAPCRGDWVRGVSRARARVILRAATCVSRGRRGIPDSLMRSGRHWTVDPRGRRNESCAVAKIAGFRGPVRQIACAGARWALRNRGRRRESVDLRM